MAYPKAMERLLQELEKLPGVGPRTAERLAHHLLRDGEESASPLARAIDEAVAQVRPCVQCFHLTDGPTCPICEDPARDRTRLLIVEGSRELEAMESAGWQGLYHVLSGSLTKPDLPRSGTASRRNLEALAQRLEGGAERERIQEVVMGTNPDLDGDGTAMVVSEFLARVAPRSVQVSRLARGVPTGASIEYTNPAVLAEAIQERRAQASGGDAP